MAERIKVQVNPQTQSPETSKDQIIATAKASNPNSVVDEIVRDINGKVLEVRLKLPDGAAQAASDAIQRNKGVATISGIVPSQLLLTNLATANGIAWTGTFLSPDQLFKMLGVEGFNDSLGTLSQAGYVDEMEYVEAVPSLVLFYNQSATQIITVQPDSVTLNLTATMSVLLRNSVPIVIPVTANISFDVYHVDTTGKMYLAYQMRDGQVTYGPFPIFADAVAASGAV